MNTNKIEELINSLNPNLIQCPIDGQWRAIKTYKKSQIFHYQYPECFQCHYCKDQIYEHKQSKSIK